MNDGNIIACAQKNVSVLNQITELLDTLFEIPNTDPRLVGFIQQYVDDHRFQNQRELLNARIHSDQEALKNLQ